MKLLWILPVLLVFVVGVSQNVEAYDGKIKIMVEDGHFIEGEIN